MFIESIAEHVYSPVNTAFAALAGLAAVSRQPDKVSTAVVRAKVQEMLKQPPEQMQWQALFNIDDYAIVYAEKP